MGKKKKKIKREKFINKKVSKQKRRVFMTQSGNMSVDLIAYEPPPKIEIPKLSLQKMMALVNNCTEEIGWFNTMSFNREENKIVVEDTIFIPKQTVSGVTVKITDNAMGEIFTELIQTEGKEKAPDISAKIRVWCHSHVNMGATPSGVDTSQMMDFFSDFQVEDGGNNYFMMIILNKREEIYIALYDFKTKIKYVNPECILGDEPPLEIEAWAKKSIEEKVEKYKYVYDSSKLVFPREDDYLGIDPNPILEEKFKKDPPRSYFDVDDLDNDFPLFSSKRMAL